MKWFDDFEAVLISLAAKLAPWLALAPTGYAIGHAAWAVIGWPVIMAVLVGMAVESLGIATSSTALRLRSYNESRRRQNEPEAPVKLAYSLVGVYFGAAVILTAVLERNFVLALFPVISLVAVINQGLNLDHANRLHEVGAARQEAKEERAQARREKLELAQTPVGVPVAQDSANGSASGSRMTYAEFAALNQARNGKGPLTAQELIGKGVPKTTAFRWVREYKQQGGSNHEQA